MKRLILILFTLSILLPASRVFAAGISVSAGSSGYVGDSVTVTITASGTTFNAFSGTIGISGPISVTATYPGDALWVTKPDGAGSFAGALTDSTTSFRIARLTVRGTGIGTGHVSISGAKLADKGPVVGTDGGSVAVSFSRRPTPPGTITVASATHPDQETAYEATAVTINWDQPSGVTGFSYLFDQIADTIPPGTVADANTTVTYENQAVGVYYFHIKAKNGDGWGPVTHFKVQIKEPDPKVNDKLAKPHDITVRKAEKFTNNITDGLFTGLVVSGMTEPDFMANIRLEPMPILPENKILSAKADATGNFQYAFDFPIPAGFYKLTVQGQNNKILTPTSDALPFEISQAKGGTITMLTSADEKEPVIPPKKWWEKINWIPITIASASIALLAIIAIIVLIFKWKRKK